MAIDGDGYVSFVLHGHLPFIRHPEHDQDKHGFHGEEKWFFQAMNECYIPLIKAMGHLYYYNNDFNLTLSLSPTLVAMMKDPLLKDRTAKYLDEKIATIERMDNEHGDMSPYKDAIFHYKNIFKSNKEVFDRSSGDITKEFARLQDYGKLELMTCFATHGFSPNLQMHPEAIRAQVRVAFDSAEKVFGKRPEGIWMPECAYFTGIEEILESEGVKYTFMDSHGINFGEPSPRFGVLAPALANNVAFFGRDQESSKAVWSASDGYPGDPKYRDFHFGKINGVKLGRIEKKWGNEPQPYVPSWAFEKTEEHARNFLFNRGQQLAHAKWVMRDDDKGRKPILVCPYDAELLGHWWFEGPEFLKQIFIQKSAGHGTNVGFITPSQYLKKHPWQDTTLPAYSTWGNQGDSDVWVDGVNDWMVGAIAKATEKMVGLANKVENPTKLEKRALNVAARETLLAQCSDWPFIVKTDTDVPYSNFRVANHLENFYFAYEMILNGNVDEKTVKSLEERWPIFEGMDSDIFKSTNYDLGKRAQLWKLNEPVDNYSWGVKQSVDLEAEKSKFILSDAEQKEIGLEDKTDIPSAGLDKLQSFAYMVPKHSDKLFVTWDLHSDVEKLIGPEQFSKGEMILKLYNIGEYDIKSEKTLRDANWYSEQKIAGLNGSYYLNVHPSSTYAAEIRFKNYDEGYDVLLKRTNLVKVGKAPKQ